jgi:hypothetical protein
VFLTGEVGLEVGARYGIEIDDGSVFLYGPLQGRPRAVALQRPLHSIDATVVDARLVIMTAGARAKPLLVFATTDPADPSIIAAEISGAAASLQGEAS